ncbi:MAG: 50S ribosomal protein L11 methyltransferase [Clostridia bacterium]|nr:50S ribosomal protein L11 methyltransferase [Clostridia bacterium]
MKYTKITVVSNRNSSEIIAQIMFDLGSDGVSIDDPADLYDLVESGSLWDYVENRDRVNREDVVLISMFDTIPTTKLDSLKEELERIKEYGFTYSNIITSEIDSKEWESEWKKYYTPISFPGFTIVPVWLDYEPKEGEKIIKLDPGLAFGTGSHATTKLCLVYFKDFTGKDVIDIGCGSGILGITASYLGAKSVYMCDIDPQAIQATNENVALNDIDTSTITVEEADLLKTDKKADAIVSNMTAEILNRLAPFIMDHLNPNAEVIISGILEDRMDEVIENYTKIGLTVVDIQAIGEWRGIKLQWK